MTKSKHEVGQTSLPSSTPVSFPRWREVLHNSSLSSDTVQHYESAVFGYLKYLKSCRQRASVQTVLEYLAQLEDQQERKEQIRTALRWFFQTAAQQSGLMAASSAAPVIQGEKLDAGGPEWEKRLVTVLRTRQMQWRTEQTYRGWAHRFAGWLEGKPVEEASGEDIKRFLEHLAVHGRVAGNTQRQALNALVFLIREAFGGC